MILYHGSNVEVSAPKLLEVQRELDFGRGFYTTTDVDQAFSWARRTSRIKKTGSPKVSVYELDETMLQVLDTLRFEKADEDWLKFVSANRRGRLATDTWDIIMGPVANDQTMPVLVLYLDGFLTEQETIARLLPQKLKDQVVLKTQKALACLKYQEVMSP